MWCGEQITKLCETLPISHCSSQIVSAFNVFFFNASFLLSVNLWSLRQGRTKKQVNSEVSSHDDVPGLYTQNKNHEFLKELIQEAF